MDNDAQGNLTAGMGYTPVEQKNTLAKLLLAAVDMPEDVEALLPGTILHTEFGPAWVSSTGRSSGFLSGPASRPSRLPSAPPPFAIAIRDLPLDKLGSDDKMEELFLEFLRERWG